MSEADDEGRLRRITGFFGELPEEDDRSGTGRRSAAPECVLAIGGWHHCGP